MRGLLSFFLTALLLVCSMPALADSPDAYFIGGIVRDSLTLEPLPFASVAIDGYGIGTLTNDRGIFEISAPNAATALKVTCLGYETQIVPIRKKYVNMYDVQLSPSVTELQEVVVGRSRYSKRNNPAVDFARKLRNARDLSDPERNPYFSFDKHQTISIGLNDFVDKDENSALFSKFPFLWDHVDTSEVSGKPVLTVMFKEKASKSLYRKSPQSHREIITGLRQEGIDEIFDQASMLNFLEDMMREINLFDDDINLLANRFVSPLSRIAPDFYKFYLTDTIAIDGDSCIVLSFYPHNKASFGFNGQVCVSMADSSMFIRRVNMRTPRDINLNFIQNLYISQDFARAPDGSRLKLRDDLTLEMKIAPGTPGLYARRNLAFANHSFDPPQDDWAFSRLETEICLPDASSQDEEFWENARLIAVTENERNLSVLIEKLRQVPIFYYGEKFIKIMFSGYVNTGNPSKFDYGPVNTTISHNGLEGWRFRAGGMTTAYLSKRLFSRAYTAYGTRDHKWKYGVELEYSLVDKAYHSREFPMHSFRFTSLYDIDQIGQHYLFTNMDNIFLSLKRMDDNMITYHNVNKLEYTLELPNNFSVLAEIKNEVQHATYMVPFVDGRGIPFRRYNESSFSLQLRYAPGEKFYQTKSYRIPINFDAPILILSHTIAPKGFPGNTFALSRTEASVQMRFWLSAFGYIDAIAKGGHVWSQSPFPNLLIPNANLSYTIQPESYALMNPLEFVNDSFASAEVTYWANGLFFNMIPVVKKLRIREVFAFRCLWGHLSDRNNPALNDDLFRFPNSGRYTLMSDTPYMEVSAGLDNILSCLRIDYVWRLSYLNVPYPIDRRGIRIALHATF